MSALLDTNIAVHLRDGDPDIISRVRGLSGRPRISIVTRIELEAGIVVAPDEVGPRRRAMLDTILEDLAILDFGPLEAAAYAKMIAVTGYSRPRILDRMIAATALARHVALITMNGKHFRDIPGLDLIEWPSPSPA